MVSLMDDITQTETANVGILAYGSLISDPGDEIDAVKLRIIENIETPFCVEFARSSSSRGGAPTLIPVGSGGRRVNGTIIVVSASTQEAHDMVYRREIHQVGSERSYKEPAAGAEGRVRVKFVDGGMMGVASVLYTDIDTNITDLTAAKLADLAIASVRKAETGKDGISYLMAASRNGIRTALSDDYAAEILRQTQTSTLEEALQSIRA
jgi:cation transport regulator ChaC